MTSAEVSITKFFKKYPDVGIVLPDGWYGRPRDSYFRLEHLRSDSSGLVLTLEGGREVSAAEVTAERTRVDGDPALRLICPAGFRWAPQDGVSAVQEYAPRSQLVFVAWT